jgi:hypothetical protein
MEGGGVPGGDGVGDARRLGLVLPRHRQRRRARPPERSLTRVVVGVIQPQPDPPRSILLRVPSHVLLVHR